MLSRLRLPAGGLLSNGAWSGLASVALRGSNFILTLALTRLYGPELLGTYSLLVSTMNFFQVFVSGGSVTAISAAVAKAMAEPERKADLVASLLLLIVALGLTSTAIVALVAPLLASDLLNRPSLTPLVRTACPLLGIGAVLSTQQGVLNGLECFRLSSLRTIALGVLTPAVVIAGGWLGGLDGALSGSVLAALVTLLTNHKLIIQEVRRRAKVLPWNPGLARAFHVFFRINLPSFLGALSVCFANWFGPILLAKNEGGLGHVAVFTTINQMRSLTLVFSLVITNVALPRLARVLVEADGWGRYRHLLVRICAAQVGSACLLALPLLLAPGWFLGLYDPSFPAEANSLRLQVAASLACVVADVGTLIILSLEEYWTFSALTFLWAFLYSGLALLWRGQAVWGLSSALFFAYVGNLICMSIFIPIHYRRHRRLARSKDEKV